MQTTEIGEIATINRRSYLVVASGESGCNNCAIESDCQRGNKKLVDLMPYHTLCMAKFRPDKKSIYFKNI